MRPEDKPSFAMLLAEVLAGYGKPLPEKAEINIWFNQLRPFTADTIRKAFGAYRLDRPDFAPAPNGIAARCTLLDGRPDENEAWAVALSGQDEAETVVWTDEMAKAFDLARPLLASGDEIGARMAFKDAYKRLVQEARAMNRPANWTVSVGWDATRHQAGVQKAVVAGLLTGSQPALALPNESGAPPAKPEGLRKLMEAMAQLEDPVTKAERLAASRVAEQAAAEKARREEIERQTKDYLLRHPEARYGKLHVDREGTR